MSFGKPNYDGGKAYKKKNHFDLSDGDLVARIFPPFGSLKDKGLWHVFHAVHWGYKNTEGKHRPFESPQETKYDKETKTNTVVVRDAALDRLNSLKAQAAQAKEEGNGPLEIKLNTLVGFKGTYNIDKNQHMNVMLLDGTAGELKVRHKMFLALKSEVDRLRSEGVDPLSFEDGRFFVFHREGKGNETSFKVTVYKEKIDVPGVGRVEKDVVSKIGPEVLSRLESELFDLDTLFEKPTAEEVAAIVAKSDIKSGRSPVCNEVFDARWKSKRANKSTQSDDGLDPDDGPSSETASTSTTTTTATLTAPVATNKPVITPKTTVTADVKATPAAIQTQAEAIEELSDDAFFKMIENQT